MLSSITFLLYWIGKSFYTRESGGLQVADYIFVVSFCIFAIGQLGNLRKKGFWKFLGIDEPFFGFVCCVALINGVYYFIYHDATFIYSILYFVFNFLVILELRALLQKGWFVKTFFYVNFLTIAFQMALFVLDKGRWDAWHFRYLGTFNDPNQFAFFLITRFFIMFLMGTHAKGMKFYHHIITFITFFMSTYLVVKSASTGMLLALGIFAVLYVFVLVLKMRSKLIKYSLLFIGVFSVVAFLLFSRQILTRVLGDNFMLDRIMEKLNKILKGETFSSFLYDRNLQPFFERPFYLIFGSGEGAWNRFLDVASRWGELHSTVLGLWFYYGILPYLVLWRWVIKNFKGAKLADFCVYIALFVEMLTLINHRQASLWIIFMVAGAVQFKKQKGEEGCNSQLSSPSTTSNDI